MDCTEGEEVYSCTRAGADRGPDGSGFSSKWHTAVIKTCKK